MNIIERLREDYPNHSFSHQKIDEDTSEMLIDETEEWVLYTDESEPSFDSFYEEFCEKVEYFIRDNSIGFNTYNNE